MLLLNYWTILAGDLEGVAYLMKYTTLEHLQADQVAKLPSDIIYRRLVQVVVSHTGELVGKRLKDVRFRTTYGAAVLGVHRSGEPWCCVNFYVIGLID